VTTDLNDVFAGERMRRVEARQQHLVQLVPAFRAAKCDEGCVSRLEHIDIAHLSRDRDCGRSAQTNDSESSRALWVSIVQQ
jgi:hypothetical protein